MPLKEGKTLFAAIASVAGRREGNAAGAAGVQQRTAPVEDTAVASIFRGGIAAGAAGTQLTVPPKDDAAAVSVRSDSEDGVQGRPGVPAVGVCRQVDGVDGAHGEPRCLDDGQPQESRVQAIKDAVAASQGLQVLCEVVLVSWAGVWVVVDVEVVDAVSGASGVGGALSGGDSKGSNSTGASSDAHNDDSDHSSSSNSSSSSSGQPRTQSILGGCGIEWLPCCTLWRHNAGCRQSYQCALLCFA